MSIRLMTQVFKDDSLEPMKKLVMLSLADNANDEGFCYPSIDTITKKTSLSKPTVIKHIKELEEKQYLLSKKRNSKSNANGGGRLSTIYIVFPLENIQNLDEDLLRKFDLKIGQSKEALPIGQSKEALPLNEGQSKEALPKPSPSLFNHHLFNKLNKAEKDLFLEYLALRKTMKLKTTLAIQERLLNKYFEFGQDIEIIQNAITSNWKDFYAPKKQFQNNFQQETKAQRNRRIIDEVFAEQEASSRCDFDVEIIE